jgi:hypothetical protein
MASFWGFAPFIYEKKKNLPHFCVKKIKLSKKNDKTLKKINSALLLRLDSTQNIY